MRDEKVSVDKRISLVVGGSGGVRAKMTGDWREGWERAISFFVVGGYETSLLMSPTVEDGGFVW